MGRQSKRPAAGGAARGSVIERSGERLDVEATGYRSGVQAISSPKEAVEAMIAAGAVFTVQRRSDSLGVSFTYRVEPGGDLERCRATLIFVKSKPPQFLEAFKALIAEASIDRRG